MAKCIFCSSEISDHIQQCPVCGRLTNTKNESDATVYYKNGKATKQEVILAATLVIAVISLLGIPMVVLFENDPDLLIEKFKVVVVVVAIIIIAIIVADRQKYNRIINNPGFETADGEVVDYNLITDYGKQSQYCAVIEFRTISGQKYRHVDTRNFVPIDAANGQKIAEVVLLGDDDAITEPNIGFRVPIAYNPSNPFESYVKKERSIAPIIITVIIGAAIIAMGILFMNISTL